MAVLLRPPHNTLLPSVLHKHAGPGRNSALTASAVAKESRSSDAFTLAEYRLMALVE